MKLLDILKEIIEKPSNSLDHLYNSFEEPSQFQNEDEYISDYINNVKKSNPNGIKAMDVFEDIPEADVRLQLKVLILLSKQNLLNFGIANGKIKPEEVLKIYGNPKHTAERTQFNMNELEGENLDESKPCNKTN